MILEMAMESLFAVVDIFFVAQLGDEAVATVGLTESVLTLIYALAVGLATAVTAMISRRIGEKKPEAAGEVAVQAIWMGLGLAVVLGIPGLCFAPDILRLMGAEASIVTEGAAFTRIMFGTNVVIVFLFLLNAVFRGGGNASLAMRALWIANGLNIVLDPCFIFGLGPFPELGLPGAAVATSLGRGAGVAFQLYVLLRGKSAIKLSARHLRWRADILRRLGRVGAGGAAQFLVASASWVFLMRLVATEGSAVIAGYTIGIRIIVFAILPAWGMANAAATLVGQNLGAGDPQRAAQAAWRTAFYAMLFLVSISALCILFAPELIAAFDDTPAVVASGAACLRTICLGYVAFAYGMVLSQALNGAGDTRTPTLLNLIAFWGVQIPLAYVLSQSMDWGAPGVYWAMVIAELLFAMICIAVFRQGRWQQVKV
ncbi:MAG: MATE family efflux transporter [Bacteroidetes bacterium]|nr:MAG: MATE family efflux transporter [Bacteroidota bacterium]